MPARGEENRSVSLIKFFDTHAHLHFPEYDEDRNQVIERARQAGVARFLNVGTDLESSRQAVALARRLPQAFASIGCHPHDAKDFPLGGLDDFRALLEEPCVKAIGEVGLDFFRNLSSGEEQEKVFRLFLGLHRQSGLPLVLHVREAWPEVFALLGEELKPPVEGILHCFSGDEEWLEKGLEWGFFISFACNITYKKNDRLREIAKRVPSERLLIETDSPFLPPESRRGKRNEPAYLPEGAGKIAGLRNQSLEELADQTYRNALRIFSAEEGS